ncbi:putative acyl-CoA:6-aminopenicillanic-acid-acyltransferase [Glonium stellatum]|uniref:Putative acyl-CoA:6-aminopenicillanic-acid-acyltransferase n=1 Tax=Glonium stellatum TaxID=574774 RepID=A0A8E2FAJ3_9PEZI|nr:putative acyl-CoA:6-aminopenicillanic-acid-acyltransferase [Glonium stellatum]
MWPNPTIPLRIKLSGTPREIGLEHGRQLACQIRKQIEIYNTMFKETSKLDWPTVRDIANEYRVTIERLTPDIYAEIAGIANGAELDILDIVALNCRSEIALGLFSDGCSSLGWKFKDRTLLAQNWDWTASIKDNLVIMSISQQDKPAIHMVTEAGIIGKIGFNSSSVGTCLNAIRARPTDPKKLPVHVALRVCLNSTSAALAIAQLEALGSLASAQHILIADSEGPVGLELSPMGDVYLKPNDHGMICHTNHFIQNRFVDEPPWLSGSPIRLDRMRRLASALVADGETVTREALRKKIFSDTFNAPQSICCQEDPLRPLPTRSSTLFCIVMRFAPSTRPTAQIVWGKPGSGEGDVIIMP